MLANLIEFLVILLPIFIGCLTAKRYNAIMGLITTIMVGYLIPFIAGKIDMTFINTVNGMPEGVKMLEYIFKDYIDTPVYQMLNTMGIDHQTMKTWAPLVLLIIVSLLVLVPSSQLRRRRKRKLKNRG